MKMLSKKDNITNAAMLAAALVLPACDREDKPIAETAPASAVQVAAIEGIDDIDAHLPMAAERRHFAIYNTYRMLSDQSADASRSPKSAKEEGALHAVATMEGDWASCSMQTMLQD